MPQYRLKQAILNHNRPAPRYTSYPPATCFHNGFTEADYKEQLTRIQPGAAISLYVHIPFCAKLCHYCGCLTYATRRPERVERYLTHLLCESQMLASCLPPDASIAHLHFGGGSPTLLSAEAFTGLMQDLRSRLPIAAGAEIAVEADPRQLSESKIAAYAACGIRRISFGVQDFDMRVLTSVNREQPVSLTWQAVRWCRDYGIDNINFDLMYGLPYQTPQSIRETMAMALGMQPSRIAFFGYAHVPWMKKHMNAMDAEALPDASQRYDLYIAGKQALLEAGYKQIGIDHFAKPNDSLYAAWREKRLHRNFQGYTTDAMEYLLGLGVSAISCTPAAYIQNSSDIALYEQAVEQGRLPVARGFSRKPEDNRRAHIIEALMCYGECELSQQEFSSVADRLEPLLHDRLIDWDSRRLRIAPDAELAMRLVASAFDSYTPWQGSEIKRHAQAV